MQMCVRCIMCVGVCVFYNVSLGSVRELVKFILWWLRLPSVSSA